MRKKVDKLPIFATRLEALKKQLGITNQKDLAVALGTDQGAISRWTSGKTRPLPAAFIRMASLAQGADKLFFLEEAGVPADFFLGTPMLPAFEKASVAVIAESLGSNADPLGGYGSKEETVTIPLLRNPKTLGTRNSQNPKDVEITLTLPATWFPGTETEKLKAIRLPGQFSPFIEGNVIALVDVSRRDPDRLLGCVVAVRTQTTVEPMRVRKDGSTYFLVPLHEDATHPVRVLRESGTWSILGRIMKWIGDAPASGK